MCCVDVVGSQKYVPIGRALLFRNTEAVHQRGLTGHRGSVDHQVSVFTRNWFVDSSWQLHDVFTSRRSVGRTGFLRFDGIKKFSHSASHWECFCSKRLFEKEEYPPLRVVPRHLLWRVVKIRSAPSVELVARGSRWSFPGVWRAPRGRAHSVFLNWFAYKWVARVSLGKRKEEVLSRS